MEPDDEMFGITKEYLSEYIRYIYYKKAKPYKTTHTIKDLLKKLEDM